MGTVLSLVTETARTSRSGLSEPGGRLVLVVEDRRRLTRTVGYICDFLDLPMCSVGTDADLAELLRRLKPIALVCELDGGVQDGCHVMKTVAQHDPTLPIMLITGSDQSLLGAAEAVEEVWGLSGVVKLRDQPGLGDIVDFLFRSGKLTGPASEPIKAQA